MVRVGIVGCSNLGRMHAKNFLRVSEADVAAFCDIKEEPRAIMRKEVFEPAGLQPAEFADFDVMVAAVELDAIDIVLPHALHYPYARKSLDLAKHVLIEKPMVTNSAHAAELAATCAAAGRTLQISFQSVYKGSFRYIRDCLRRGEAGEIAFVHGYLYQAWLANLEKKPEKKWRLKKEISGGGQLYDSGSHLLNAMLWATELKPVRVYAEVDNRDQEVDVYSSLSIRFENGAVGNIAISGETFMSGMTSRLIITGSQREFSLTHGGQDLRVFGPGGQEESLPALPPDLTPQANFVDAILGKAAPLCPVEYGLKLAKFMDAVYASAEKGMPVDVPE